MLALSNKPHLSHFYMEHEKDIYCLPSIEKMNQYLDEPSSENMATSARYCFCGNIMKLLLLEEDFMQPHKCHCGQNNGIYKVEKGKYLLLCTSATHYPSPISHEAYQASMDIEGERVNIGDPLGLVCSPLLKIYRLHVHHLLDRVFKGKCKASKYFHLGKMMSLFKKELSYGEI